MNKPVGSQQLRTTNGCSNAPNNYGEHVSFIGAYDNHDLCYATEGATQPQCDTGLLGKMTDACEVLGEISIAECLDAGGINCLNAGAGAIYQCEGRAYVYAGAVMEFGGQYFAAAQAGVVCRNFRQQATAQSCRPLD